MHGETLILKLLDGFIESKILMTATSLGVFRLVRDTPLSAAEILARLELPQRSGMILLRGCLALQLLEELPEGLRTRPELAPFVARQPGDAFNMPSYLIDFYQQVYDQLADLDSLVRSDGRSSTFRLRPYFKDSVEAIDREEAQRYSAYMTSTVVAICDVVRETVDFSDARFVLDLCGGVGTFCQELVTRLDLPRGAFLDVPAVVALGQEDLASQPALAGRILPVPGDVLATPFPEGADLITLCRSAHDFGQAEVVRIIERAYEALPSGGRLAIIERMLPEQFSAEAKPLYLRSIYFLVKSSSNEYRTPGFYRGLLEASGFARVQIFTPARDPNRFFKGLQIVVAWKP